MSETKVKIIQPKNKESKIEETEKKLRVAAYCGVSTNSEEQATSYDTGELLHKLHTAESKVGNKLFDLTMNLCILSYIV